MVALQKINPVGARYAAKSCYFVRIWQRIALPKSGVK